jgi:prophage regulatory protein
MPSTPVPLGGDSVSVIRLREVQLRTGLARSTVYDLIAKGLFPRPIALTAGSVAWITHEIDGWLAERIAARDRPQQQQGKRRRGRPRKQVAAPAGDGQGLVK